MTFIQIKILPHGRSDWIPNYATDHAAGADLCAAVSEDVVLKPMERKLVPCGFAMSLPEGFEAQVRPRSGLAIKNGITVLNSPGTIDSDYRGEVQVILANLGTEEFTITKGMRIAQMVIAKHEKAAFDIVDELSETIRGAGGFGSTGTHK